MRGIYAITNVLTDTVYYGQTESIGKRISGHRQLLVRGSHANPYLQASWNKYGVDAFVFTPLYLISDGDMTVREKACIDGAYGMGLRLFNLRVASPSSNLGLKHSAVTRAKMSVAQSGRTRSAEHRAKISATLLGHGHSAATRAKISATLRARRHD